MNIAANSFEHEDEGSFDFGRRGSAPSRSSAPAGRRDNTRKKRRAPQQFNGIHRRRRKKIRW